MKQTDEIIAVHIPTSSQSHPWVTIPVITIMIEPAFTDVTVYLLWTLCTASWKTGLLLTHDAVCEINSNHIASGDMKLSSGD